MNKIDGINTLMLYVHIADVRILYMVLEKMMINGIVSARLSQDYTKKIGG